MPIKPDEKTINAQKNFEKANPKDILTAIICDIPEIKEGLLKEGIIEEVESED